MTLSLSFTIATFVRGLELVKPIKVDCGWQDAVDSGSGAICQQSLAVEESRLCGLQVVDNPLELLSAVAVPEGTDCHSAQHEQGDRSSVIR